MATSTVSSSARGFLHPPVRLIYWGIPLVWLITLIASLRGSTDDLARDGVNLLPWVVVVAIVNLLPVPGWQSATLAADLPIATACGLLFSPVEVGLVSFIGVFDSKEFKGKISLEKALFNRSQVGLESYLGSIVAHHLVRSPATSPFILPVACAVMAAMMAANYGLVGTAISLEHGHSFREAITRLRLGTPSDFALTFASWAVLGSMLAALYDQSHPWALLAFLFPTLLARQTLMRSQMVIDTSKAYRQREQVLTELSHKISEERTDERRLIAADLHDDVMQPLYKVTLMAHVLKNDLSTGQLLELDADLPELLAAAEMTSNSLRSLIGDLRKSPLGRGGLTPALASLVRQCQRQTVAHVVSRIEDVDVEPAIQLALYQIAKEALSNALAHSQAKQIDIDLLIEDEDLLLTVRDDGIGFDPSLEYEGHFGIQIMRERARNIGCSLFVDALLGHGTSIRVTVRGAIRKPKHS